MSSNCNTSKEELSSVAVDPFDTELMYRMRAVCHRTSMVFGSHTVLATGHSAPG